MISKSLRTLVPTAKLPGADETPIGSAEVLVAGLADGSVVGNLDQVIAKAETLK